METQTLEIPFVHLGKRGSIEVCYSENKSPIASGFDLAKDLVPNINMCIGYPTMHSYLKTFDGYGFRKYFGWIQIITFEFYNSAESKNPDKIISQVDVPPNLAKSGIPFSCYGYPADLYDAPCNNYSDCYKLNWIADTFLVSMPTFLNGEITSYLAGFKWGFTDIQTENNHKVEISPIHSVDSKCWNNHLALLKHDFPDWNFV